jgi:hypothetical protein
MAKTTSRGTFQRRCTPAMMSDASTATRHITRRILSTFWCGRHRVSAMGVTCPPRLTLPDPIIIE